MDAISFDIIDSNTISFMLQEFFQQLESRSIDRLIYLLYIVQRVSTFSMLYIFLIVFFENRNESKFLYLILCLLEDFEVRFGVLRMLNP